MRVPSGKTDVYIYFVAVDATDLVTRETGLSSWTVQRSRNGAAEVAYTTPTITQIDATNMPGVYALLLDEDTTIASTSDSEEYCVHITHSGMAPVTRTIELYRRDTTTGRTLDVSAGGEAGVDWANVGSPTTTVTLSGTTVGTATAVTGVSTGGITAGSIATDAIGAAELATDAVTEIVTAVWAAATRTLTANTNLGILDAAAIRAAIGLASANLDTQLTTIDDFLDTEVAAIKAKTDNLPSDPADASDISTSFGTVNSTLSTIAGYLDTEIAAIKAKTDNLPASPAAVGDIPSAATIADAVWDEAQAGHTTSGTFGKFLDVEVSSVGGGSLTVLDIVEGVWNADKGDYVVADSFGSLVNNIMLEVEEIPNVSGNVWNEIMADHEEDGSFGAFVQGIAGGSMTVQDIVDGVWNEPLIDHPDAGSAGGTLAAAGSAGDPWSTALPGAYGSGTAGKIIGDNINATISSRATQTSVDTVDDFVDTEIAAIKADTASIITKVDTIDDFLDTEIAAIKAKTDNLPTDPADASDIAASLASISGKIDTVDDFLDTEIAAIKAKTDNLPASPAATGDIPTANQNADALLDRGNGIETGYTPRQTIRLMAAVLAGKSSGHPGSPVYRNLPDTADRVTATVSSGNRSAITHNP